MTRVLLSHVLRIASIAIPAAAILVYLLLGRAVAIGVFVGAGIALAHFVGLVYLVGQLLAPRAKTGKPALFLLLLGKLVLAAGLLWASLSWWGVSGLGIVIGIGAALASLVLGLNRGSSSEAGQRAIAEDEARIAQELGDNDTESR